MGKVVVVGSSNTDMVIRAQRIPSPGETILGSEFKILQGGKGANQAVAAARAGAEVSFIAKVGDDDFGKSAFSNFKEDGINLKHLYIDKDNPTGTAVIIVDENTGQNSIVVSAGANAMLTETDIELAREEIAKADVLLVQLEIPIKTVTCALKIAKEYKLTTILNPAPALKLNEELLKMVDIISPNESETHYMTGHAPVNENGLKKAASKLLNKINDSVLITMGDKGVYYIRKSGEEGIVPSIKVNAIDTTAAGDVFNGYFAYGLSCNLEFNKAILLANEAATYSVTKKGAQASIPKSSDFE